MLAGTDEDRTDGAWPRSGTSSDGDGRRRDDGRWRHGGHGWRDGQWRATGARTARRRWREVAGTAGRRPGQLARVGRRGGGLRRRDGGHGQRDTGSGAQVAERPTGTAGTGAGTAGMGGTTPRDSGHGRLEHRREPRERAPGVEQRRAVARRGPRSGSSRLRARIARSLVRAGGVAHPRPGRPSPIAGAVIGTGGGVTHTVSAHRPRGSRKALSESVACSRAAARRGVGAGRVGGALLLRVAGTHVVQIAGLAGRTRRGGAADAIDAMNAAAFEVATATRSVRSRLRGGVIVVPSVTGVSAGAVKACRLRGPSVPSRPPSARGPRNGVQASANANALKRTPHRAYLIDPPAPFRSRPPPIASISALSRSGPFVAPARRRSGRVVEDRSAIELAEADRVVEPHAREDDEDREERPGGGGAPAPMPTKSAQAAASDQTRLRRSIAR